MTVYVCPERDIECGDRPANWCATCPKRRQPMSTDAEFLRSLAAYLEQGAGSELASARLHALASRLEAPPVRCSEMTDPTPEAPAVPNERQERAKFEAVYASIPTITPTLETAWLVWKVARASVPPAPPLTDERIVEIRDAHLPSQGEGFDCLAFARAILAAAGAPAPPQEAIERCIALIIEYGVAKHERDYERADVLLGDIVLAIRRLAGESP